MEIMNTLEKRDFIHSHLHQVDDILINEVYKKMQNSLQKPDHVVGYDAAGQAISKSPFVADLKEAEAQIERGEYLTIEELEKESEQW